MNSSIHTTLTGLLGAITASTLTAIGAVDGFTKFGWGGGIVGGVFGFIGGSILGGSPFFIISARCQQHLSHTSTDKLKEELLGGKSLSPHVWINELVARGEPVEQFWPYILSLLRSEDSEQRSLGQANLRIWFPRLVRNMEDFDPDESTEACREKLKGIEDLEALDRFSSNVHLSMVGGIERGVPHLILSTILGGLPWFCYWGWRAWRFGRSSTEEMMSELESQSFVADWWLQELMDRGVPVEQVWPSILSMLRSESSDIRRSAWNCLNIWFPRMAIQLANFDPRESTEVCRETVKRIEDAKPDPAPLLL